MTQFLVMLGGGIGAVIRAFVTNFFNNRINSTYPIATLVVNILGSFDWSMHGTDFKRYLD